MDTGCARRPRDSRIPFDRLGPAPGRQPGRSPGWGGCRARAEPTSARRRV